MKVVFSICKSNPFISFKSLIKRPCYKVSSSSTLVEVIEVLSRHNIGAVLVVDETNSVEGIISERDIVRRLLIDQIVNGLVASDIMTKNVISVAPNVSSSEIMKLMTENMGGHSKHSKKLKSGKKSAYLKILGGSPKE